MPDVVICDLTFKKVSPPPAATIPTPRMWGHKAQGCAPRTLEKYSVDHDRCCHLLFDLQRGVPTTYNYNPHPQGVRVQEGMRARGCKARTLAPRKSINSFDHARYCHLWFDLQRALPTTCNYNPHTQGARVQEGARAQGLHPWALEKYKVLIMPNVVICDLTFKEVSPPPATTIPTPMVQGCKRVQG